MPVYDIDQDIDENILIEMQSILISDQKEEEYEQSQEREEKQIEFNPPKEVKPPIIPKPEKIIKHIDLTRNPEQVQMIIEYWLELLSKP